MNADPGAKTEGAAGGADGLRVPGGPLTGKQLAIAFWGVGGVLLLLFQAIYRLTPLALEPLVLGAMTAFQWSLYIGWTVFNAYAEGYRGFQKSFSPRVAFRALHLARNPKPLHVALAPAFCMSLFHAKRRGKIVAWSILIMVVILVVFIRYLAQPWRGIIDAGVVVGLVWGAIAIAVYFARGLRGEAIPAKNDLPDDG